MPDSIIDIYIESSFFSVISGTRNVYIDLVAGLADNIGLRDTAVDYEAVSSINSAVNNPVEVYTSYSGAFQSGYNSTITKYEINPSMSGTSVALVNYSIPTTTSGLIRTEDIDLEYFASITKISGSLDAKANIIAGQLYSYSYNILGQYRAAVSNVFNDDYEADYTAGGYYNPLIPGPPIDQVITSGTGNFRHYFTAGAATNSGTQSQNHELFLAGYPLEFYPNKYTYKFHLTAGDEGNKQGAEWEATVISGSVLDIPFDAIAGISGTQFLNFDSIAGVSGTQNYNFESQTISGTLSYYYSEALCCVSGTNGYGFDIDLLSLKISNFSLDIDEYTSAYGVICVDITDDVYSVSTSGTYFIIDETITSGTSFTPITDGYTMCFDSPTEFDNVLGATTFTVHAENDNGDVLEKDFYVTSGYIVEYDNRTQDYGFGNQVVVRMSAENLASCPNTGTDAYFFTTLPKESRDLGAAIVGIPWEEKDLSAEIIPTTDTIYFYGKTFRIEIRAKDFAGNVMEPFTFEFKIEDKPE
jgi:hypothetical protein